MNKNKIIPHKIQVVILVGGYGKRLGSLTKKTPKPIIKINNKPFLFYLIKYLKKQGFKKFLFLAGFKGKILKEVLDNFNNNKRYIFDYYIEKKPAGNAYVIFKARKKIENHFLLMNGDTFTNLNFKKFIQKVDLNKLMNINLTKQINKAGGNFYLNKNKIILKEKTKHPSGLINSGIYFCNKKIIKFINKNNNSIEKNLIPILIDKLQLYIIKSSVKLIDIGTKINIKKFSNYIIKNKL